MFSTLSTFRKHEFEKHGLCAVEDPQVFNQYGYFKFGIQLMQKLNLLKTLMKYRSHHMIPDNMIQSI
uniref:Phospholipase A(2) n=1 Tax=Schistosoma mansoni TaxID=6183 RepID=A0A5K4F7X3_SCHMA